MIRFDLPAAVSCFSMPCTAPTLAVAGTIDVAGGRGARRASLRRPSPPRRFRSRARRAAGSRELISDNIWQLRRRRRAGVEGHQALRRRGRVLRDEDRARRHRQRRVHPGQQPHRRRPRRVQHQDAARHLLQRERHRRPSSRRARRRRRAASSRRGWPNQETDVYFFGETVEKIGPRRSTRSPTAASRPACSRRRAGTCTPTRSC